jgi:NAD(P)H-hydrate epimerase
VVLRVVAEIDAPQVLDASALNLLATVDEWWSTPRGPLVLTPHPGEFERLTGAKPGLSDEGRLGAAQAASERFGQVVVLKGPRTVVAAPDGRAAMSTVANAALATAGSGDVLAGLIGALLAQGASPFDAACLGVYLHARAGERLSMRMGNAGVLASDIAHEIPAARHELDAHSS